jgi:hypothetical protein
MKVRFSDIEMAYTQVSASDLGESQAWLDRRTGQIYTHSDLLGDKDNDELPDDIDDDERYLEIPDRRDLDLGTRLVFAFVREHLPDD